MSKGKSNHVTLQQYFEKSRHLGITEFRVVVQPVRDSARSHIYIHPLGVDGESRDFSVFEDVVCDVTNVSG